MASGERDPRGYDPGVDDTASMILSEIMKQGSQGPAIESSRSTGSNPRGARQALPSSPQGSRPRSPQLAPKQPAAATPRRTNRPAPTAKSSRPTGIPQHEQPKPKARASIADRLPAVKPEWLKRPNKKTAYGMVACVAIGLTLGAKQLESTPDSAEHSIVEAEAPEIDAKATSALGEVALAQVSATMVSLPEWNFDKDPSSPNTLDKGALQASSVQIDFFIDDTPNSGEAGSVAIDPENGEVNVDLAKIPLLYKIIENKNEGIPKLFKVDPTSIPDEIDIPGKDQMRSMYEQYGTYASQLPVADVLNRVVGADAKVGDVAIGASTLKDSLAEKVRDERDLPEDAKITFVNEDKWAGNISGDKYLSKVVAEKLKSGTNVADATTVVKLFQGDQLKELDMSQNPSFKTFTVDQP